MDDLVDIPDYEGLYAITPKGQIWSYPKWRQKSGRWLKWGTTKDDYPKVNFAREGSYKTFLVHRLVAIVYIPNPLGLPEVAHKDHDRLNPQVSNLEWSTHAENVKCSAVVGHYNNLGERNPKAFLDLDIVRRIRILYEQGIAPRIIAKEFGIRYGHCLDICNKRIWKNQ